MHNASIAFVDEDQSALSKRLFESFYPPRFKHPRTIRADEADRAMDNGSYMFIVVVPPRFESDLRAGRWPEIQVNIDATAMQQASIGAGYIRNILTDQVLSYLRRSDNGPNFPSRSSSARPTTRTATRRGSRASWPSSTRSRP